MQYLMYQLPYRLHDMAHKREGLYDAVCMSQNYSFPSVLPNFSTCFSFTEQLIRTHPASYLLTCKNLTYEPRI